MRIVFLATFALAAKAYSPWSLLRPRDSQAVSFDCPVLSPDAKTWDFRCQVSLGNQQLRLFPDLGTDITWVVGPDVPAANRTAYKVFNTASDFVDTGKPPMDIGYSDGFHINGDFGKSSVGFGSSDYTYQGEFGVATEMVNTNERLYDGVIGLGHATDTLTHFSMFASITSQLPRPVFSLITNNNDLVVDFGDINSQIDESKLHYTPQVNITDPAIYYGTHVSGYQVQGGEHNTSASWDSILDTGSIWTYVPRSLASAWLTSPSNPTARYYCENAKPPTNPSQQYCSWIVDCNATTFPDVSFDIAGTSINVEGEYFVGGNTVGPPGSCIPLLQGIDQGFLFGVSVLRSAFVVVDQGEMGPRIGWAQR